MGALAAIQNDFAGGEGWLLGSTTGQPVMNRLSRRRLASQGRSAQSPINIMRPVVREFGADLWASTDAEDFADRLDVYASDERKMKQASDIQGALLHRKFNELPDPMAFLRKVKERTDGAVVPDLMEGLRMIYVAAELCRSNRERKAVPWGELELYAVPAPLLNSVLMHARSTACLAALIDLAMFERPAPPPWLVKRVARGWVDGLRSLLRLLTALFDDSIIPEDLLPADQRLTHEGILQVDADDESALQSVIEKAASLQ